MDPEPGVMHFPEFGTSVRVPIADRRERKSPLTKAKQERLAHEARLRKYDLTEEQYDKILAAQGGLCAICDRPAVCIDHDHVTGAVRGILCRACNWSLGQMGDDPERLRRAAAYLERMNKDSATE